MIEDANIIKDKILARLDNFENPKRVALSKKYPRLKPLVIFLRRLGRRLSNFLNPKIKYRRSEEFLPCVIARHQSLLRRRLGTSEPRLQERKIINLRQALKKLNGVIIEPGKIFSLWQIIGRPEYKHGYVDGMLLANGQIVEGVGGGLCQLSNFLFWIFLHAPIEIIERHHHSMDVFPDSNRTLPFGGGATILYNFIDLQVKNISSQPLQLKIWLTDDHLKGQLLSDAYLSDKFHIFEANHFFVEKNGCYFRYNEIYRETLNNGQRQKIERIVTNFAPVLYKVSPEYFVKNNINLLDLNINKTPKIG